MKKPLSFLWIQDTPDWVCVHKRANTLSVPSRMASKDPRHCVGIELQSLLGHQIYPVHRLDFEVSGLLLFAKNPRAQGLLNKVFEAHKVQKIYRALSFTTPKEVPEPLKIPKQEFFSHREISDPLCKSYEWSCLLSEGKRRSFPAAYGRESQSRARLIRNLQASECQELIEPIQEAWLWELEPVSGRRHQLRLHMCLSEHPIIGDVLYGGQAWKQEGIALCAKELVFESSPELDSIAMPQRLTLNVAELPLKQQLWLS